MPRLARLSIQGMPYHVLCRGNNRDWIFHDDQDFHTYLNLLANLKSHADFMLYHYALMNSHVHLLIEPTPEHWPLAKIMHAINLRYSIYYKARYQHVGHLFQDRFKSILIDKNSYLLACGAYIELNPVSAHIVDTPEDYPYCSFTFYSKAKPNPLLTPNPIYLALAESPEMRQKFFTQFVKDQLQRPTYQVKSLGHLKIFGDQSFLISLQEDFGVSTAKHPRGRPKKLLPPPDK